jgi:hypothetical protein
MSNELETALRSALRERAADVPAISIDRLTRVDYHPRTRSLRPPLAIGMGAVAGAAGTAVAVVSLGAGATSAFAGWTPTPTPPSPGQVAAAYQDCKAKSPVAGLPLQAKSPVAGLPLKLTDTRGPFTFAVYADRTSSAICISGPSFTSVSGSSSSAPASIPAGKVLLSTSHTTNRDGQAYSFGDGHTGAGVSAVTLVLDDGTKVEATVANGWFVAWWPGGHEVKTAEITTPAGAKTQTFDLNHESPCGAMLCTGGAIGTNSNGPVSSGSGGSVTRSGSFGSAGSGQAFNITKAAHPGP